MMIHTRYRDVLTLLSRPLGSVHSIVLLIEERRCTRPARARSR